MDAAGISDDLLATDRSSNAAATFQSCSPGRMQMRIGTPVLALVTSAVLAACTSTPQSADADKHYSGGKPNERPPTTRAQNKPCKAGEECTVVVDVAAVGSWCQPKAVPTLDWTSVASEPNGKIKWTLSKDAAKDYEFSNESYKFAIFIKNDPGLKFKDAKVNGGDTLTISFDHKHVEGDTKVYSYALTVRRKSDGAFCDTLDPWMLS